MKDERYERVKELLPDWVAGRLDAPGAREVAEAVARDEELAAEAELLESLLAARAEPPRELESRIRAAVREDHGDARPAPRRARWSWGDLRVPRWAVAAAAVAVVGLGTVEIVNRQWTVTEPSDLEQVALEDTPSPWVSDDGLVAGAPVLDELSDEALTSLLEELGG